MSSRAMVARGYAMHGRARHGMAWRRRARHSVACHSMAWHCAVKHCITQHCHAKHGIAQRHRTQHRTAWHRVHWRVGGSSSKGLGRSGVAAPCPAPWAPRKAPRKAGLMERSRWLCFQHRHLQAGKGLLLDTSSKGRRPKVGGLSAAQKINESTPDV